MGKRILRRTFLQATATAAGSLILGFDPRTRAWITEGRAISRGLERIPKLDGSLTLDESSLTEFSIDEGRNVVQMPMAVLKPASVPDVVTMVQYANEHELKIGIRGQGHSQYGQSLVEQGIVIDSRTLNAIELGDPVAYGQKTAGRVKRWQLTVAKRLYCREFPEVPSK